MLILDVLMYDSERPDISYWFSISAELLPLNTHAYINYIYKIPWSDH